MMANAKCGTCRYWEDFGEGQELGQCRLHPPQVFAMLGQQRAGTMSVTESRLVHEYPETPRNAWCGQHQGGAIKSD